MQNNVTDLSQKLQRSLDNNYNVIDMPAVIEIISTLEKTAVTKELLETTRLAKSINELRRRTSNESLAKRAKQLLKKWRDLILPNANGQVKPVPVTSAPNNSNNLVTSSSSPAVSGGGGAAGERSNSPDTGQLSGKSRKRPARSTPEPHNNAPKRPVSSLNGQARELDFSDNSNCSMKDFTSAARKSDVIFINSDSNSSLPDHHSLDSHSNDPMDLVDSSTAIPKKRGRKKGSKNHKNLIIAAEESFTNKMSAVSRNSKVKTTQELLADLQNRTVVAKDIELRAAQLTESLSRIDQKLNPQKQINKNVTPIRNSERGVAAATTTPAARASSGGVTTPHSKPVNVEHHWPHRSTPEVVVLQSDDEIVDVVGTDPPQPALTVKTEPSTIPVDVLRHIKQESTVTSTQPLTISGLMAQLPPIDLLVLEQPDDIPPCTCPLPPVQELPAADKITVQIVDGDVVKPADSVASSIFCPASPPLAFGKAPPTPEPSPVVAVVVAPPTEDDTPEQAGPCAARAYLRDRYELDGVSQDKVALLHSRCLASLNGNVGLRQQPPAEGPEPSVDGLYVNIVPNLAMERLRTDLSLRKSCAASENYKKYSISNAGDVAGGGDGAAGVTCRTAEMLGQCRTDDVAAGDGGTVVCKSTAEGDCADGASSEFREWHQTLDVLSYNGETLRILPYVIID
ncbi:Mediator complex subunit 26 [Carabus blaptoides fortunei]